MIAQQKCDVCGKLFTPDSRNFARGWGRCCSKTCAAIKREAMKKPAPEVQPETSLFIEGKHIATLVGNGNEAMFTTLDTLKTSELRIGNHLYDSGLKVVKIECLMSDRYVSWDDRDSNLEFSFQSDDINMYHPEPDELCPIPLTAEILTEWCGFNKAKRVEGLTKHGIDLVPAGDAYYDNRTGRKITTLHQLQNYVYAMTGEELEVKLPTKHP